MDNALDKLKSSVHNIVKPIRIAAGNKFSAEGLSYAQTELKKWAGIELSEIELEDDELAKETDEYKSFDSKEIVLNRWMRNIYMRSHDRIGNVELRKLWYDTLTDLPLSWKRKVYEEYISHCNVIGATCSAISDTNYSATEKKVNTETLDSSRSSKVSSVRPIKKGMQQDFASIQLSKMKLAKLHLQSCLCLWLMGKRPWL